MPSFAVSIGLLGLLQAALVALPGPLPGLPLKGVRSSWWAVVPALSIVVVIAVIELDSDSATALAYLALVAVPPLAALALGTLVRGARPALALVTLPLFALAWASSGSLVGETAAAALSALGCVGLGWLLVSVAPAAWLKLSIYAMAAIDVWFVSAQLLQEPNAVLSAADPGGLPRLQVVEFGSARMGFGDIFVAALVGCLLATPVDGPETHAYRGKSAHQQLRAAVLVAILALAFDLLFFAVDTLPATVPVALALALVDRSRKGSDTRR
jgi:hypothetical protein